MNVKNAAMLLSLALGAAAFSVAHAQDQRTTVRWFVGLGAGTDEPTINAQKAVVEEFNKKQNKIKLVLEIVQNAQAYDVLATQIASGNAPDIVGPVGIRGRASFPNAWTDLAPLIEKNKYSLADFDPSLVNFYKIQGEGQLGIPFAVYPSFLMYNKDLFDEAGLPYPPKAYGQPYTDENGKKVPWNIDTMSQVAKKLTVDSKGNDATSAKFNPKDIVQWGFGVQYGDLRAVDTLFGAGNFVDAGGKATIPSHWREGTKWLYSAMWKDHFYPNGPYGGGDRLGKGNWFDSGNLAMNQAHTWLLTCCLTSIKANWDMAALPTNAQGKVTAKLHADTFAIPKASKHKDEAFKAMSYLLSRDVAGRLAKIYGGMPARRSLQKSYIADLAKEKFPGKTLNWNVVTAGLKYADNPNHEEGMPSFREASDRYTTTFQKLQNDANVNVDAELDKLQVDLQKIFDNAKKGK